jgi:hypothetical protein
MPSAAIYPSGNTLYPVDAHLLNAQSVEVGITATASGNQATARALTAAHNDVATVGTAADSVKLPLAVAGLRVYVENSSATSMQVFGDGTDTINNVATATGVAQAGGKSAVYFCTVSAPAGKWFRVLSA